MTLKQTTIGEHSGKAPEEQAHSKSFAYSGLAQTMLAFWSAADPSAAFGWASATKPDPINLSALVKEFELST